MVARILEAAAEHIEKRFTGAIVVQRLNAQMVRDRKHENNRHLSVDFERLGMDNVDHIVEEVGHRLLFAKCFVKQLCHEETHGMA